MKRDALTQVIFSSNRTVANGFKHSSISINEGSLFSCIRSLNGKYQELVMLHKLSNKDVLAVYHAQLLFRTLEVK